MNIKVNGKTYTTRAAKGRIIRRALEINEIVDFDRLKATDLDMLVDFAVEVFGNKFSADDFYDGVDADDFIPTLIDVIYGAVNGFTQKINEIPNEAAE